MAAKRPTSTHAVAETALVTGASSGIGEALARRFARAGHPIVLVARRVAALEALAAELRSEHGVRAWVIAADLAQPDAARSLAAQLRRRRIAVEIVVNNAGVLEQGAFAAMTPQTHQRLIDLNVSALTALLAHFIPPMVERGRGRILNVASIAAFQPVPLLATYAATKAFVLSLTESLAEELRNTGVTVTALCPGITDTGMLSGARDANARLARLPGALVGQADAVADAGYRACVRGIPIEVPGAVNEAITVMGRAAPKWLTRRIAGRLSRSVE